MNKEESVKGFTALTDLFTVYNLSVNVDNFYQHFRNGDMPIGIADYATYNMLKNAAPELDGPGRSPLHLVQSRQMAQSTELFVDRQRQL